MEAGIFETEKDFGKARFQQELNRWFENRGIITDLRSHLRHLMITALQNTQIEVKPTNGSSPKAQALNLIVAEYLFRHGCHYTLSVFTSEVPTLANFNPGVVLRGGRRSDADRKRSEGACFRDNEIDEIFNALGMSSLEGELLLLKAKYLEKGNEASLVELLLQTVMEMSTKLQVRKNLESLAVEGDEGKLLSKKWSTKVADILVAEKMPLPQVTAVEEAIFRITEREIKRIIEEERRLQMQMLTSREKRIQEYLKKHEDDILLRLMEAEKDLATRKDIIDEELIERQKHLTKMAVEWSNKHEEILRLSKNFHTIENENKSLQKKLKELEEEKSKLMTQGEAQMKTIEALRGDMNALTGKLKEVTDSNTMLSERIQVLISRENKEVSVHHEEVNQETIGASREEIPLLWSRNMTSEDFIQSNRVSRDEDKCESRTKLKELPVKIQTVRPPDQCYVTESTQPHFRWGDADSNRGELSLNSSGDEDDASLSPSSEEIIIGVRKKLQDLEEETNRINQNYLEYKLKCISTDSSSESPSNRSDKPPTNICDKTVIKETKCCQTVPGNTIIRMQKLEETKVKKNDFDYALIKKLKEASPRMPAMRIPTKRQLQNRDFFLKSRQMLHELEKQNLEDLQATTPSIIESPTFTSGEELSQCLNTGNKKSPEKSVLLTPLRTTSFYCNDEHEVQKPPVESPKNKLLNSPDKLPKDDMNCLALLEEARIRSPQMSARKPLRQQILLSESDKETSCQKSVMSSPEPPFSGKMSAARKSGNESFW